MRCDGATSSSRARCRIRPRPAKVTIPAISPRTLSARRNSQIGPDFPKRLAQSKKAGRLRGIGLSTYIEACGNNGPETATVKLERDGSVTVLIGSQSTGQGHATAYAQLVAEHLGLPPERVNMVQGDTDRITTGVGTGGSSSIPCGGASLDGAAKKLAENLKALAGEALEASADDLEIADGAVRVVGTDRAISFAALAQLPDAEKRLTATDAFTPPQATYPNGTHIAEVEIDPATGETQIANYVVVDDFGATLNPLLLAGQVHGGTAQGIGQALMERAVYDPGFWPALDREPDGLCGTARRRGARHRLRDVQRSLSA